MAENSQLVIGQRVRINEEDDPPDHVGKMALVEQIELAEGGEPMCTLRVDGLREPITLPQRYLVPIATIASSLLANNLFLPWDPDDPRDRLRMYCEDRRLAGHVLETLMFYNHVIVPTVDYAIIVPLVHWIGIPLLKEMLESEALSFVRFAGTLGYLGDGNGLVLYEIHRTEGQEPWWIRAASCPPQEAVALQLKNRLSGIPLKKGGIELFGRLVDVCSTDTALPRFSQKVAEETYRDILGSDILRNHFAIRNTNLKQLAGLKQNEMRTFSRLSKPAVAGDEIDITIRLAMLNLEAYLAEEAAARDMVTDPGFSFLLDAKIQRFTGGHVSRDSFSQLMTIEALPDLVSSIANGEVDLTEVWNFRNTRNADQFRQWFDRVGPARPAELTQAYIEALRASSFWKSPRAKIARFIVLQGIGAGLIPVTSGVSFLVSMGLSVADCFLLERIRRGYNPRYFIDELRQQLFPK